MQLTWDGLPDTCFPPKPELPENPPKVFENFEYWTPMGGKVSKVHVVNMEADMLSPLTVLGDSRIKDEGCFEIVMEEPHFELLQEKEADSFEDWVERDCVGTQKWKDRFLLNGSLLNRLEKYFGKGFELKRFENGKAMKKLSFRTGKVKEEESVILVHPEYFMISKPNQGKWECQQGIVVFNRGMVKEKMKMCIFMFWGVIRSLNEAAKKYLLEMEECASRFDDKKNGNRSLSYKDVMVEKNIPWRKVKNWRRLMCTFGEVIWQWLATYTDVAVLARGVKCWDPEVTHWAHLHKYPAWKEKEELFQRWENPEELESLQGPYPGRSPTVWCL